eukprot:1142676-Pelagomonas_calceolata.AAC.3
MSGAQSEYRVSLRAWTYKVEVLNRVGYRRSSVKAALLKMLARWVSVTFCFGTQLCWYPRLPTWSHRRRGSM